MRPTSSVSIGNIRQKEGCDPELDGDVGRHEERSELGRDDGLYGATRLNSEGLQGSRTAGQAQLQPLERRAQLGTGP